MIIDTFLFYNELDLLEIRLEELKDVVDRFVLVEAQETFSGKPKPLVFAEAANRFSKFPVEYVQIPTFPPELSTSWQRENYPRHVIGERLRTMGLAATDVVMLSDLDEIPRTFAQVAYIFGKHDFLGKAALDYKIL